MEPAAIEHQPSLSVVIPTLNEARYLTATLVAVREHARASDVEVIIVDCGSDDGTADIAKRLGARVIVDTTLRGHKWRSLNAGAMASRSETLLFLDADTRLPPAYDSMIHTQLARPGVVGGAFEHCFGERSAPLHAICFINRLRYRVRHRFYGDQGIFAKRSAWRAVGGWPDRPILEAAYFCVALQRLGRLVIAPATVSTSARRFIEGGVWRVFLGDVSIWLRDALGLDVTPLGHRYWERLDRGDPDSRLRGRKR